MDFYHKLSEAAGADHILKDEPMSAHTTFRIGGPADYFVVPEDAASLGRGVALCRAEGVDYFITGNGSNLLVGDGGYRGVVFHICHTMDDVAYEEKGTELLVEAGAGVMLSSLARQVSSKGYTGFEYATGIPGTLGGGVTMNAGAYGGEMKDILKSVTVLTADGQEKELTPGELDMSYRHSSITEEHYMVLGVTIALEAGSQEQIRAKMEELKEKRVEKQPLEYPSAGSTFKRPEGYFAGKLIMDAGLRGFQVGGAAVSEKHCGFVINKEKATASDVYRLIQEVQQEVYRQFGVKLETEVKMVGDFR